MTLTTLNIDIKINTEGNISTRALGNGALGNRKKNQESSGKGRWSTDGKTPGTNEMDCRKPWRRFRIPHDESR